MAEALGRRCLAGARAAALAEAAAHADAPRAAGAPYESIVRNVREQAAEWRVVRPDPLAPLLPRPPKGRRALPGVLVRARDGARSDGRSAAELRARAAATAGHASLAEEAPPPPATAVTTARGQRRATTWERSAAAGAALQEGLVIEALG